MSEGKKIFDNLSEKHQEELRATEERLKKVVAEREGGKATKGERLSERSVDSLTFRYETVRCGKKNCTKCPHGPYWYVYWKENGRTRSRYVGRTLPLRVQKANEAKQKARLERHSSEDE